MNTHKERYQNAMIKKKKKVFILERQGSICK